MVSVGDLVSCACWSNVDNRGVGKRCLSNWNG